jgi:hypothetical protein
MVTPKLTPSRHASPSALRTTVRCTTALWIITAVAALAGAVDPGLALARAPHPTLTPTFSAGASIFLQNARILLIPVLLSALGIQEHQAGRCLGDLAVLAILTLNGALVGIELGRWNLGLIPYLPQLPLEWLAVGAAASSWTTSRTQLNQTGRRQSPLATAAITAGLLAAAAAIEVLLTPHAPMRGA